MFSQVFRIFTVPAAIWSIWARMSLMRAASSNTLSSPVARMLNSTPASALTLLILTMTVLPLTLPARVDRVLRRRGVRAAIDLRRTVDGRSRGGVQRTEREQTDSQPDGHEMGGETLHAGPLAVDKSDDAGARPCQVPTKDQEHPAGSWAARHVVTDHADSSSQR